MSNFLVIDLCRQGAPFGQPLRGGLVVSALLLKNESGADRRLGDQRLDGVIRQPAETVNRRVRPAKMFQQRQVTALGRNPVEAVEVLDFLESLELMLSISAAVHTDSAESVAQVI